MRRYRVELVCESGAGEPEAGDGPSDVRGSARLLANVGSVARAFVSLTTTPGGVFPPLGAITLSVPTAEKSGAPFRAYA
jgi:hypothetical protein